MNVCTMIASGPLDVPTFLAVCGLGLAAIALSFARDAPDEEPSEA